MTTDRPGDLLPGVELSELANAVRSLQERIDLLAPVDTHSVADGSPQQQRRRAFIVMPFGPEDLQIVYEEFVKPALETKCQILCVRGDDIFGSNVVMDDVSQAINTSEILVADLTGRNPNVFYEVGIAHALDKPVLLISQSLDDVPFDLRHRRILLYEYTPRGCKRLEEAIVDHVTELLA